MKINRILVLILLFMMVLMTGCKKNNMKNDYPRLDGEINIIEINGSNVIDKIENQESFILIMGFPRCMWCQMLMPILNEELIKNNKEAYYLDILDMRDNPDSKELDIYKYLYNYCFDCLDQENDRINAPTIIKVDNGLLVDYHVGTVNSHIKDETGVLRELKIEEKEELIKYIQRLIN